MLLFILCVLKSNDVKLTFPKKPYTSAQFIISLKSQDKVKGEETVCICFFNQKKLQISTSNKFTQV